MEIYDISELKRNLQDVYDITQITFQYDPDNSVSFKEYTVQSGEEMRIDMVCDSIYGNTKYVDILCSVNNIDNPLNIKEGESIIYPVESHIIALRYSDSDYSEDIQILINPEKKSNQDPNRKKYQDDNQSIPPTLLPRRLDPINLEGSNFNIGEGLF